LFLTAHATPTQPSPIGEFSDGGGPGRGSGVGYTEVRPRLATEADRLALWQHLAAIDCFATDHAPHTRAEKESETPPPGFPGLETALALLLGAVHDWRLTLEALVARMHTNVKALFSLPDQPDTYIEVDPDLAWTVRGEALLTRCRWSPWEAQTLRGRVVRTVLRGQVAYEYGQVLARPGSGLNINQAPITNTQ
jgi:carbamoyl-phosphate synthase/aspartate carbamoyltransferase/dihydroorotase